MALVDLRDMLNHAYHNGYAVGAFDVVDLEFVAGVMEAAEHCQAPVIVSLAESHFEYFDFELLMAAVVAAARRASVPVAIHLDHGAGLDTVVRAIRAGCNGVMVDASEHPLAENIRRTRAVVKTARACGVPVEGELGYVPGVEGKDAERHPGELAYTDVEEARRYVDETGVDFLAVSVGTVHGRFRGAPRLDFDRLARLNEALAMPLVIHGGTGLGDEQFRGLIAHGVAKINYYTALADAAARAVQDGARRGGGYAERLPRLRQAVREETERCIRLWGGAGRAREVLAACRPWSEVAHVIVYNVDGPDPDGVAAMMAEGRRVLSAIPGVREVVTGRAVSEDAPYRYSWLIRFCHRAVIEHYRAHPDHVAFADGWFRPVAADRITIDFECLEGDPPPAQTGPRSPSGGRGRSRS